MVCRGRPVQHQVDGLGGVRRDDRHDKRKHQSHCPPTLHRNLLAASPALSLHTGDVTNATGDNPDCQPFGWKCQNRNQTAKRGSGAIRPAPDRSYWPQRGANLAGAASPARGLTRLPHAPVSTSNLSTIISATRTRSTSPSSSGSTRKYGPRSANSIWKDCRRNE